jgi:hypothetical protein
MFAHGQVNPFGLTFDPLGNLYSADCHTRPQYLLLRGAHYPSFGKPDDGLGFGPEMIAHDHGSTGIAGTVYYAADHFPPAYRGTLFNGNPVTNKVNHDTLEWHGSSPRAVEQPDFLTSDDPWFRPVDLVLGPDGALYLADFYNRIIGHYEVDLAHPGRDRTSGRIWRIVYRGPDGKGPVPTAPDLSAASAEALVNALARPTCRSACSPSGSSSSGSARPAPCAEPRAREPRESRATRPRPWASHQLRLPRPEHAGRGGRGARRRRPRARDAVLSEDVAAQLAPGQADLMRRGLQDPDAHVRRAAADALGGTRRRRTSARCSPRATPCPPPTRTCSTPSAWRSGNQLESGTVLGAMPALQLTDDEQRGLADVVMAVGNPDVGSLMMSYLKRGITDPARTAQLLLHAARRLPAADVDSLAQTVLQRFPADLDLQRQLFVSVIEGLAQRGASPGELTRRWGVDLAKQLAVAMPFDGSAWTYHPLPGAPAAAGTTAANPFVAQRRPLNDPAGKSLWSSHPAGEQLTGVLRSRPFAIPQKLGFLLAGITAPRRQARRRRTSCG